MARCRYNLRQTFMPTAPSNGQWVYNGFNSSDLNGPFDQSPSVDLFAGVTFGDTINLGDDPDLPYEGKDNGFYSLTYNYSGGSNNLIIEILDNGICTGPDQSLTISSSVTNLDLSGYLSSGSCPSADLTGEWINVDGASGWSPPIFNPSVAGIGTYHFDYKLAEFDVVPCSSCPDYDTRITVNVTDSFSVEISTSETTCTKTISIEHPDTTINGTVKVLMENGKNYPTFYFRNRVTDDCSNPDIVTDEFGYNSAGSAKLILREWNPAFPGLENGGFIQYIRLFSDDLGPIDVPVAPSGIYQAVFSGSGGTTNATGLTFNTVSASVFMNSVMIAIKNYLFDVQGISSSDLSLSWDISGSNQPAFICDVRHNAASSYVGIDRVVSEFQYKPTGIFGPTANVESKVDMISDATIITPLYNDDCVNNLRIVTDSIPYTSFIVPNTINYNEIITTVASVPVTINTSHPQTKISDSCNSYLLTANPSNCGGTISYLWNNGSTSQNITVTNGTFTVTSNCTSPVATDDDTVSV